MAIDLEKYKKQTTGTQPIDSGAKFVLEGGEPDGNFISRLSESFKKRGQSVYETGMDIYEGRANPLSLGIQLPGQVAGGVGDIIGEGLRPIMEIPFIKGGMERGVSSFLKSENILGETNEETMARYASWKEANPEKAKNIESIVNIGSLLIGAKAEPKVTKTISETGEELLTKTKDVLSSAEQKIAQTVTKSPTQQVNTAIEAITPKTTDLTPTEYGKLLRSGRITPKTSTKPAQYLLSDAEKELAKKYSGLLQNSDPVKNTNNVLMEIINKDKAVGDFLRKDTSVYVKNDLRNALIDRLSGVSDITVPKAQLAEARKDLINTFMSRIPESNTGRTFFNLWEFRKDFDQVIKNKLNAFSGSPTLKKQMEIELRNGVQEFIKKNTKAGVYGGYMDEMTDLYKIMDLLEMKGIKERGFSGLQQILKNNPTLTNAAKWLIPLGLGYKGIELISQ